MKRVRMLTKTIGEGIARRGFFLLLDERLKLLSDEGPSVAEIDAFAAAHGWQARILPGAVIFSPEGKEHPQLSDLAAPDARI